MASESECGLEVRLEAVCEAELDEQWSFVGQKSNQRWLWHAVDHATNTVIAYVFGKRKDVVFKQLKTVLDPFGIARYYTDDWGVQVCRLVALYSASGYSIAEYLPNVLFSSVCGFQCAAFLNPA